MVNVLHINLMVSGPCVDTLKAQKDRKTEMFKIYTNVLFLTADSGYFHRLHRWILRGVALLHRGHADFCLSPF